MSENPYASRAKIEATEIMRDAGWSMAVASYETVHTLVALAYAKGGLDSSLNHLDRIDRVTDEIRDMFTLTEAPHV